MTENEYQTIFSKLNDLDKDIKFVVEKLELYKKKLAMNNLMPLK
jgi:hypothetical protein